LEKAREMEKAEGIDQSTISSSSIILYEIKKY
jgi:hypothetical protein